MNRYDAFKRGDYAAAANPVPSELSRTQNDLSLIDLDESQPSTGATNTAHSEIDELASLFGPSSATPAPISLGSQPPAFASFAQTQRTTMASFGSSVPFAMTSNSNGLAPQPPVNYSSRPGAPLVPAQFHSTTSPAGTPPPGSIRLPGTPQGQALSHQQSTARMNSPAPNYFPSNNAPPAFNANGASGMGILGATPAQQPLQPQVNAQPNATASNQPQGKDPFADLVGLF